MDGPINVPSVASLLCTSLDRKRTHNQMSGGEPSRSLWNSRRPSSTSSDQTATSSYSDSNSSRSSSSYSPSIPHNIRIPTIQPHPRRGYDMRRPAPIVQRPASAAQFQDVIDLTEEPSNAQERYLGPAHPEQRPNSPQPPHGFRPSPRNRQTQRHSIPHVIDLSDGEDIPPRPPSPEIQFLSSRTRSRSLSTDDRRRATGPEVRLPPQHGGPMWLGNVLPRIRELGDRVTRGARDQLVGMERFPIPDVPFFNMPMPQMMDFQAVGFDLNHPHQQPPLRPPTYDAPPLPKAGFTRSNTKGEVSMVCPGCDEELGVGDEIKRQVWVVRMCGHVYCGACIKNRKQASPKKKKKGQPKSPPNDTQLTRCVVDSCGKPLGGAKVVQIYL